ncbi:alpha/beta hydrolase [Phanerochaete sordida]|uniref:Alpha/beta hydrolase n=1 Tax=Phanerochaete sordida TaxID=48140 RepID=A0A9P3GQA6_9APHY|nr:alpha/beta hydrolase [Phanerochaete sordida]
MHITEKLVVSADGTTLYAQAAGDPTKPALVCIHGFAGTSFAFQKQLADAHLLQHAYVIAYDLRGNGRSDKPEAPASYAGECCAADFQAVCTAFAVTRPFLLGWSLGALLVLDVLAHLPPHTLRGAVFSGGPVPTRALHATYMSDWLAATLGPLLSADAATAARAAVAFVDGCFARPREAASYAERARWLGEIVLAPPATRVVYEAQTRARDDGAYLERMRAVPLLVLQGTLDVMVDPPRMKVKLDEVFAGKKDYEFVWLEGVGHCPAWEAPKEHDEAVVRFIRRYS